MEGAAILDCDDVAHWEPQGISNYRVLMKQTITIPWATPLSAGEKLTGDGLFKNQNGQNQRSTGTTGQALKTQDHVSSP